MRVEKKKTNHLKRKQKKNHPKREDPAMDEAEINRRLLQNALDQANAKAEQKLEERLKHWRQSSPRNTRMKGLNCKTRFKFEQSRGEAINKGARTSSRANV